MNGIQILLISGIAFLFAYYVLRIKNAFFDLLVLFVLASMAIFFVLMPIADNNGNGDASCRAK